MALWGTTPLGVTRTGSVDSPLMNAISDTSLGTWMQRNGLQLYGWVDVGANLSTSSQKPGGNAPAAYLYTPNTVQLDQAVIYLDRFPTRFRPTTSTGACVCRRSTARIIATPQATGW